MHVHVLGVSLKLVILQCPQILILYCAVPTGIPGDLVAMATTPTSIQLTWNPPPIHEHNGVITSYTITQVKDVSGNSSTDTTTDLMLTAENLRPFTCYTFNVAASTSVGTGPLHPDVPVCTPEAGKWREILTVYTVYLGAGRGSGYR